LLEGPLVRKLLGRDPADARDGGLEVLLQKSRRSSAAALFNFLAMDDAPSRADVFCS